MEYTIIGDSCTDLPDNLKEDPHIRLIPLSIHIEDHTIIDDETFDQADFLRRTRESKECPKSSCPSPEAYMEAYQGEGDVYAVTLSGNLSGSYNSAVLGRKLYLEENPKKNIGVIDSCSASVGQTLLVMKLQELIKKGLSFAEVMEQTLAFRAGMKTKFVLETLDTLRKNGRLNNLTAVICSVLNIKPIMGGTPEGLICKLGQARGINRAIADMAKMIEEDVEAPENRTLGIAHCNNYKRALFTKDEITKRVRFKNCIIVDTAGISSLYANDGGIIVAY